MLETINSATFDTPLLAHLDQPASGHFSANFAIGPEDASGIRSGSLARVFERNPKTCSSLLRGEHSAGWRAILYLTICCFPTFHNSSNDPFTIREQRRMRSAFCRL
jgi:hypothetical protein